MLKILFLDRSSLEFRNNRHILSHQCEVLLTTHRNKKKFKPQVRHNQAVAAPIMQYIYLDYPEEKTFLHT